MAGVLWKAPTKRYIVMFMLIMLFVYYMHRVTQLKYLETKLSEKDNKPGDDTRYEELLEDTIEQYPNDKSAQREKVLEEYKNITKYPIFQPTTEEEFPTSENRIPRIPHVIHQIWSNITVPDNFVFAMQSFAKHNPTWKHMFWTYHSGRKLISERHPQLLKMFDNVGNRVQRSDILRIVVMYEFGGVYADLDVKNVRPLDIATFRYSCILPTETFEHSTILNGMPVFLSNAVILCKKKHPFFKHSLHYLQFEDPKEYPVTSTGPGYFTRQYMKYNNLDMYDLYSPKQDNNTNSPYFYKGSRDPEADDGIYIPNTQYFMDNIDPNIINKDGDLTACLKGHELSYLAKRGCAEFEHRREIRKRRTFAFTIHYWVHMWVMSEADTQRSYRYLHVKEIIPNCTMY